jgi:methionyl aminopeptidase
MANGSADHSVAIDGESIRQRKKALDQSWQSDFNDLRHAAEIHTQVRQYARKMIKPGMTMIEIAGLIENGTRALVEENGLKRGIGFPTGLSLNHSLCSPLYSHRW